MLLLVWMTLCLAWPGTNGFMIHNIKESLCLEDSLEEDGVQLNKCNLDSVLQQWTWTDRWFLLNTGTLRCLSAVHSDPVQTITCNSGYHIKWKCNSERLISLNNSLALSAENGILALSKSENNKWKSLDMGDICQDRLRSRRQSESDDLDSPETEQPRAAQQMTEAQKRYLQWFYRTEDPTPWKFAMLAFAFLGLLIGCMLLVMGMMSNRNRKQIAKFKAASTVSPPVKAEMEELQVIITEKVSEIKDDKTSSTGPTQNSHSDWEEPTANTKALEALKPGEIMVTWKDEHVSNMYTEPALEQGEDGEDVQS